MDHCESLHTIVVVNFFFAVLWLCFGGYWMANTWWVNQRFAKPLQKMIFFVAAFKASSDGCTGALFSSCPYSSSSRQYWSLAVNTAFTLYSTLLYTTLLLIAKGLNITRSFLERQEISTLVTLLVLTYLGFSAYMLEPVLGLIALLLVVFLFYLTLSYCRETLWRLEAQISDFRSHGIPQMIAPAAAKWRLIYRFSQLATFFFLLRILHMTGNEIVLRGFSGSYYDWFLWSDALVGTAEAALLFAVFLLVRARDAGRLSSLNWEGNAQIFIAPMAQAKISRRRVSEIPPKAAIIVVPPREKGHFRFTGIEIGFPVERCYSTQRLLVTGAGPERQGILREMTRIVWEDSGNVLNSQMSRLAGELTVMMLVEVPEEKVVDVQFKLSQQLLGLNVCSKQVQDAFSSQSSASLTVSGADNAETLQRVAKFLQQLDISLSDVVTQTNTAPMGGTLLFSLRGLAQIPAEVDRADLQRDLQKLSEALEVDVCLSDASE